MKYTYSPYQEIEIEDWKKALEANTEDLRSVFKKVINGINDRSIFSEDEDAEVNQIEFHHGLDTYEFRLELLDKNGRVIKYTLESKPTLNVNLLFKPDWSKITWSKFEFQYPDDLEVYYEEERDLRKMNEKHFEFFYWFAKNWIECGGHEIGIKAYTRENSISRIFNLNQIHWDYNIKYSEDASYPLNRKLSDYELRNRIGFLDLSGHNTRWRYFEKENAYVEFGIYQREIYTRKGPIGEFENTPFEKIDADNLALNFKIDELINEGYFEKPRPSLLPKILTNLIDWKFRSNITETNIKNVEVDNLEHTLDIKIPYAYRVFITSILHKDFLYSSPNFQIGKGHWGEMTKYLLPHEIIERCKVHGQKFEHKLPIAETDRGDLVLINCKDASISLYSNEEFKLINNSFVNFLAGCIKISKYFSPIMYHIDRKNTITVDNWFKQGGKVSDIKTLGGNSVLQDSQNSYQMLEILLRNGADPNRIQIYSDRITRKNLDLLIQYGLDLDKKLQEQDRLERNLRKKPEFEDLFKS